MAPLPSELPLFTSSPSSFFFFFLLLFFLLFLLLLFTRGPLPCCCCCFFFFFSGLRLLHHLLRQPRPDAIASASARHCHQLRLAVAPPCLRSSTVTPETEPDSSPSLRARPLPRRSTTSALVSSVSSFTREPTPPVNPADLASPVTPISELHPSSVASGPCNPSSILVVISPDTFSSVFSGPTPPATTTPPHPRPPEASRCSP